MTIVIVLNFPGVSEQPIEAKYLWLCHCLSIEDVPFNWFKHMKKEKQRVENESKSKIL
jgi:hypothetical protein